MRNNYTQTTWFFICFLLCTMIGFSQTEEQRKQIIKNYDLEKLHQLYLKNSAFEKENKKQALKAAKENGWPLKIKEKDGTFSELQGLRIDGTPIYYSLYNTAAAISTRANYLHNGGGLGLNVEGQGMTAHVWDGGPTRISHEDYSGRVSIGDGNNNMVVNGNGDHAQHVTGTIMGLGLGNDINGRNSKGMAPQANAVTHEWSNDLSEATAAAAGGMLLSNHSYGNGIQNVPDWAFGAYTVQAQAWDELMYNSPYYLMVAAAGNDGQNNNGSGTGNASPLENNFAFDKLSGNKTAKNNMVVANGYDAVISIGGDLTTGTRNPGSSEGPTDDLRIKPDIMGNGTSLFSAGISSNASYGLKTGTSMASPNVCGSLLLLQQHYSNVNGSFMRAATLKGLALHTADDTEITGPDANTGWGYMNTKAAAETISSNGLSSWISEETLSQGETMTFTVQSDGINPLLASISWTDPVTGGYINSTGTANEGTAALVNDLDIRVEQTGTIYYPWKLTGVNSNTNANGTDNIADPFERIDINGASGTYTVTVTHKGNLYSGKQQFSLIITGLSSNIALLNKSGDQTICSNNDAVFNFDYNGSSGSGTSVISANNLPTGVTASFSQNNLTASTNLDVTFSNLSAAPAGNHIIEIIADNGSETEMRNVYLTIYHNNFSDIVQQTPANGTSGLGTTNVLTWDLQDNSEEYVVEIALDPNFNTIIDSSTLTTNQYTTPSLTQGNIYYWRVLGKNRCATAASAIPFNFQIGGLTCNTSTQSSSQAITDQSTVNSTLNITDNITVGDLNVRVAYNHTWIGDVALTLISPSGTRVELIDILTCTTETDFNIRFDDDSSNNIDCTAANGGALSTYKPIGQLLDFNGELATGTWTLEITDGGPGDVGTVTEWELEICEATIFASPPNFINNSLNVEVNSTYTTVTGDIEASSTAETAAQQTYTLIELPTIGNLQLNATNLNVGDTFTQDDVNTGKITYLNTETNPFVNQFKVNISNAANGWLPNQVIIINAVNLNISDFELGQINIWPNPVKSKLFIQLDNASNDNVTISLFDIQGRRVYQNSFSNNSSIFNKTIELNNIASGSYIIQIEQDNKKATKQLIINH